MSDVALRGDDAETVAAVPPDLFIAGRWRAAAGAATMPVEDPSTGSVICEVADATVDDAVDALTAADSAFASWRAVAPRRRADLLRSAHDLMMARIDELARLMTLEMGKPLAESRAEVGYAAGFLRWYAEEAVRINGRFTSSETGAGRILTMRQPVGPCLFITPWNFPLAMGARKVGPALAAGCTVVVKPARQTPLSMLALGGIFEEAGLPPGVLNVIPTARSGATTAPLLADGRLRKLSFTGSTEVGRSLIAASADQVLRVSMELGGNAPIIVFDDADVERAVEGALVAKMRNGGEACTSANRLYVHERLADDFAEALAERMASLMVGRGVDPGTDVGPLIDEAQRRHVRELVDDAVGHGADVLCGGRVVDGPGYFYSPTVLTNVPTGARILDEEIFGPVAPIRTFSQTDAVIDEANATQYGLVAYVFTQDIDRAFSVCERLETGMVGLNQGVVSNVGAPFGGVKQSGFGREGGPEGLDEYLETKYVALATS